MSDPVEVTTKYVTTVDDLPAAWVFIMDRLDKVGPDPQIKINPIWVIPVGDMIDGLEGEDVSAEKRQFEVVVSGMVEEKS
jgi:hypothetical protein